MGYREADVYKTGAKGLKHKKSKIEKKTIGGNTDTFVAPKSRKEPLLGSLCLHARYQTDHTS